MGSDGAAVSPGVAAPGGRSGKGGLLRADAPTGLQGAAPFDAGGPAVPEAPEAGAKSRGLRSRLEEV